MKGKLCVDAHLIVIGIVSRSDFHHPCSKCRIDMMVGDDGDYTVHERKIDLFCRYNVCIAFVFWGDSNGGIAKHGFRTCGGDVNIA